MEVGDRSRRRRTISRMKSPREVEDVMRTLYVVLVRVVVRESTRYDQLVKERGVSSERAPSARTTPRATCPSRAASSLGSLVRTQQEGTHPEISRLGQTSTGYILAVLYHVGETPSLLLHLARPPRVLETLSVSLLGHIHIPGAGKMRYTAPSGRRPLASDIR